MRDDQNLLSEIVDTLSRILEPVVTGFRNEETLEDLFKQYGWDLDISAGDYTGLQSVFGVSAIVSQIRNLYEQIADDSDDSEAVFLEALALVVEVLRLVKAVSSQPTLSAPFNQTSFWDEFLDDLISDLVQNALKEDYPVAFAVLLIIGIFEIEEVSPAEANRITYIKKSIQWEKLGDLVTDPLSAIKDTYRWGNTVDGFHYGKFFRNFDLFTKQLGFSTGSEDPDPALLDAYFANGNPVKTDIKLLNVPLVLEVAQGFASYAELGFGVMPITPKGNMNTLPEGFLITPAVKGSISSGVIGESEALEVGASLSFEDGSLGRIEIRPDSVDFVGPDIPSIDASISITGKPESPYIIIGSEDGHRIELEGFFASLGVMGPLDDPEVIFKAGTNEGSDSKRLRFILQAKEGDGFIRDIVGEEPQTIDLSGYLTISSKNGVSINGNVGFQLQIPLHLSLGVIEIESLTLGTSSNDQGGANIPVGVSIVGNLGPLVLVVENIGAEVKLIPTPDKNKSSALGNLDIEWGFKPPNGVGLSVDAGVIKGGGYLYFDFDKEEYAGILELDLSGIVSVKAIGLITTKMPDGSKGFSLLLIITAEFGSPIQLGFGFTLSGVGGLLGLNRTMRLEEIASGIRDGGINSVMFPQNVIENAPRIISDLKKYFPVEEGTFLIGPMVKIGWGTPNLVAVSLGVIIEIPGNIAILGVLKLALPDEDAALVVIQVNFIGAIEFDKKRLWFFASIFESRVLFITLEGEMGLLVGWGADANFVVSVGGFHPAFNPPALPFGSIVRIAINILNTDFARIRIEGYFAVTSNTVQFGAKVELFFGVDGFNIDGHLAFDALFRFSPFYFIITISASLSVKVFGVGLFSVRMRGELEGPTPWHVEGTGSISLLFFDIDVDFSHTWGNEEDTTLPPITVMPLLMAEFEKMENWQAVLPDSNQLLVSLREIEQSTTDLILHPVGSLKVSQRFVPLGITVDKVGNQKPDDANEFSVDLEPGSGLSKIANVTEQFATGQYISKSDGALLSSKSYEPINSGIEMAVEGEQYRSPKAVRRVVRYEKIIIDSFYKRFVRPFFTAFGSLFTLFLKGNAISRSTLSYKRQKQLQPFAEKVAVGNTLYGVASNSDNAAFSEDSINFTSQVQAEDYLRKQIKDDANLADQLHVIPQVEMQEAA